MKSRIWALLKKDVLLELRQQHTFYGILLYVAATVFVLFMSLPESPESIVWNALFWVIQLFVCVTTVAKSFLQESRGRMLYFYSICSPVEFIVAKLIFNLFLMLIMSLISLMLFYVFLDNPVANPLFYLGCAVRRRRVKSCFYTDECDCCQSSTECRFNSYPWFPCDPATAYVSYETQQSGVC